VPDDPNPSKRTGDKSLMSLKIDEDELKEEFDEFRIIGRLQFTLKMVKFARKRTLLQIKNTASSLHKLYTVFFTLT
jgi:hypothetical protein